MITTDVRLDFYAERVVGTGSVRSSVVRADYILQKDSYSLDVAISEIFPSPAKDQPEWIELVNLTDQPVMLAGWTIDDEAEAGSKPHVLAPDVIVPASGRLLLKSDRTKLALNNDGDEVWLRSPDEGVKTGATYEKIKTNQSVVVHPSDSNQTCVSDVATPGESDVCITFAPIKQATDADRDFLPDDREQWLHKTDAAQPDTDGDGWLDGFEVESGLDPLSASGAVRATALAYRKFVAEHLKPKWQLYVRKGLVVRGSAYPVKSIEIHVAGDIVEPVFSADGKWEVVLPGPMSAGDYPVDLLVTDEVGKRVVLADAARIKLHENYVLGATGAKKTKPKAPKNQLKVRYRNVIDEILPSLESGLLPSPYDVLRELSFTGSGPSASETAPLTEKGALALIFGTVAGFKGLRRFL